MVRSVVQLVIVLCLTIATAAAQDARPKVPPGRDPGGVAIALFSTGIDYTLPAIAARLARDGEGEIIAWDFESNDARPFDRSKGSSPAAWGGDATAIATAILQEPAARLIAVRLLPEHPTTLARAIVFLSQTPARVAVIPMASSRKQDWEPFAQAAAHFQDMLFIVATGEATEPSYPAALHLANVLAVPPSRSSAESTGFGGAARPLPGGQLAIVTASRTAAIALARNPKLGVAELKDLIVDSSR